QELAGKAVAAPRVVNDSSGRVERWTLARLPFAPTATGYRLGVGRVVTLAWPLALPERSLAGRYDVRVGLIPAGTAALQGESRQTLEAAWRATLPAGSLTSYSK
ncbi:MAG: hypothetical protein HUU35_17205, partial [Armatimonadetes bacterium]|nr:hypothetical protein [Armatimonadota bacterium]